MGHYRALALATGSTKNVRFLFFFPEDQYLFVRILLDHKHLLPFKKKKKTKPKTQDHYKPNKTQLSLAQVQAADGRFAASALGQWDSGPPLTKVLMHPPRL